MSQGSARSLLSQLVPVAGVLAALVALYVCRETVVMLFLALLLAHVIRPPVDLLARKIPRGSAAGLILLLGFALVAAAAALVLPRLLAQAGEFAKALPQLLGQGLQLIRTWRAGLDNAIPESWVPAVEAQVDALSKQAVAVGLAWLSRSLSAVPQVLGLLILPVLAFFFLKDGSAIADWVSGWVPAARRKEWNRLAGAADRALTGYVRGQGLVCLWQAVQCSVAFELLGLPYSVLLGVLAGLAEAVPYVGSTLVAALLVLVGLSQGGWHWAWYLGTYAALNQLINLVITPRIMSRHVELHPLATLVALSAGAELAGFTGVVLALPVAAVLQGVLESWRSRAD